MAARKEQQENEAAARGLTGLAIATLDSVRDALSDAHAAIRGGRLGEARRELQAGLEALESLDATAQQAGGELDRAQRTECDEVKREVNDTQALIDRLETSHKGNSE